MSFLYLLVGVVLVIGLLLFVRSLVQASINADPECDYDEEKEEIVAMGGQVDASSDDEPEEEPSQEEEPKA